MARTGEDRNTAAENQYRIQGNTAFDTGQNAINAGIAGTKKLIAGTNIGADPFKDPTYLANVNRLQANSLDASQEAGNAELEALNKRTGGLNSGIMAGGMRDLLLRKMRLADQLSSQRAQNDYRSNLAWQQQLLQNLFQPAELESPYYSTATSGRAGTLKNLTDMGIASYGPWMAAIQAAGQAAAAGLAPSGGGSSGGCWIAEAIYGSDDWRTHLLRSWLNNEFRESIAGDLVMRFYLRFGRVIAAGVRRFSLLKGALMPLFERALTAAIAERQGGK